VRHDIPKLDSFGPLCAEEKSFGKASGGFEQQTLIWLHADGIIMH
jgi:hypothetical protein